MFFGHAGSLPCSAPQEGQGKDAASSLYPSCIPTRGDLSGSPPADPQLLLNVLLPILHDSHLS